MQLIKAGQAEKLVTCLGGPGGIPKAIAMGQAGYRSHFQLDTGEQWFPLTVWHWNGAVVRVSLLPTLRQIGRGYLVRENTGEIFHDEEEKGSCVDPLYSADTDASAAGR